jgi:transcriptional regulator with XRE-family HTH domain
MIGTYIRAARERQGMLVRELASELDMDTAMLSKMERSVRPFRKEDLKKLSSILNEEIETLYTHWLADKALRATENEEFQYEALELALSKCKNEN